jgi:hypothetical protein
MLLLNPYASTVNAKAGLHTASFTYGWTYDDPAYISIGGRQVIGSEFVLNLKSLAPLQFNSIKSIRFNESFSSPDSNGTNDGELYIVVPSTGEVTRIGYPTNGINSLTAGFINSNPIVSGSVPVSAPGDGSIRFIKVVQSFGGASTLAGSMFGILDATVYDYTINPYVISGFSYTL